MPFEEVVTKQPRQFESSPLFKTNVKVMKFWSLLLRYDWRRYVCLVPSYILNIGQFLGMFIDKSSLDGYIRGAFFFLLWLNGITRTSSILLQRRRYEDFMEEICTTYEDIQRTEGTEMSELLKQLSQMTETIQNLNMVIGTVVVFGIGLYPLFTDSRVHPYEMFIPWVNKLESPWYEIIYVFQFAVSGPGCCIYIPFTSIMIAIYMFCTLMCKVLQNRLRNLNALNHNEAWKEVVWCIRYHKKIIRYVETLNALATYVFLVEFISFGALLCALLFLVVIVESLSQTLIVCSYITMVFSQVAAMYWFANELSDQSVNIAVAAYDCNWLDFDVRTRKALLLFIARAQKPCSILVGNIYPMSLEMLQSLLNVSYSYFTVLRRVYG